MIKKKLHHLASWLWKVKCSIKCLTNPRETSQAAIKFSNAHRKGEKNSEILPVKTIEFFWKFTENYWSYMYHIYYCFSSLALMYVSAIPMKSMHCDTCPCITSHVISNTGRIVSNFPQSLDAYIEFIKVRFWATWTFLLSLKCISTTWTAGVVLAMNMHFRDVRQ